MSKQFDIYPTKKSRRILVTISDIFITLISAVFIFELVVMQIAKPIIKYNDVQTRIYNNGVKRRDLLAFNEILFKSDEEYDFSKDLENTAINYIEFQIKNDEETKKYDVLFTYFVDLKKENTSKINEMIIDKCTPYFDKNSLTITGTYRLSKDYLDYFSPYFEEGNEMSSIGKNYFDSFKEKEFLKLYQEILIDITNNELVKDSNNNTFSYYSNLISNDETYLKNTYIFCSYISFLVAALILYLIVPLTNKKGRTLSEIILKIERINIKKMNYLKKSYVLVEFLFNLLESLVIIIFVPYITLQFYGISLLYGGAIISLLFLLTQLIILLINEYSKTLKEIATNSLCIDSSLMDDYYKEISNLWAK